VAAQLGVSLSTVEKHLASALERLMARMEEQ
jgi:RNA polymerase sigma-70 factor (ECF subfamily)